MIDKYKTISSPAEGMYKEKGSKFLAYAYPVTSEQDVKEILETLKKQHHKARHHCYAYVLGKNKEYYRANDAGEPANSAGKPILGQIYAKDITNVLVVVVRYFGGVKLGVGGLINAYKTAAEDALNNAKIVEKDIEKRVRVKCNFNDISMIQNAVAKTAARIKKEHYDKNCNFVIEVSMQKLPTFEKLLSANPNIDYQVIDTDL
ncbi:MAG: YigZ family protein [Bacteroidetes bacterium]|nr:MAG: YigZ family protein [Bacteroidota bacterium]